MIVDDAPACPRQAGIGIVARAATLGGAVIADIEADLGSLRIPVVAVKVQIRIKLFIN